MPRIARIVIPDVAYHITQRGNNRQAVFFGDEDEGCRVYLEFLAEYADEFALDVLGYCLMTNHIHLVAVPHREDSLALAVGRTDFRYTRYVNRVHRRSGHLWQNRFYSCGLDETHTVAAMRYVEQNPVRAKMVRKPWRYAWSSAAAHVGGKETSPLAHVSDWLQEYSAGAWRKMLTGSLDDATVDSLRAHTRRGRPLGSTDFVARVEKLLGRRVRPLPVGRPKGWRKRKTRGK